MKRLPLVLLATAVAVSAARQGAGTTRDDLHLDRLRLPPDSR